MRIEQALVMMVDPDGVAAAAGVDGTLEYGRDQLRDVFSAERQPDIALLFAAAGFSDPDEQVVVREPCHFWTPEGEDSGALAARIAVGASLGEELAARLNELGIQLQPCEFTADPEFADFYVWQFGQDIEVPSEASGSSGGFLNSVVEAPGSSRGGGGGSASPLSPGGGVSAPSTGDGGLLNRSSESWLVAPVLVAVGLILFFWAASYLLDATGGTDDKRFARGDGSQGWFFSLDRRWHALEKTSRV